ncbi:MAG: hypothetical protein KDD60_01415 [Bdellovibrionales bacterium]|nr:hypothetical protein [Bdellovibrionales bacterium]
MSSLAFAAFDAVVTKTESGYVPDDAEAQSELSTESASLSDEPKSHSVDPENYFSSPSISAIPLSHRVKINEDPNPFETQYFASSSNETEQNVEQSPEPISVPIAPQAHRVVINESLDPFTTQHYASSTELDTQNYFATISEYITTQPIRATEVSINGVVGDHIEGISGFVSFLPGVSLEENTTGGITAYGDAMCKLHIAYKDEERGTRFENIPLTISVPLSQKLCEQIYAQAA